MNDSSIECPLCNRIAPKECQSKHHLVPKSKKGKITIKLCKSCGSIVHRLFTNKELAKEYNSIELLLSHPDVKKWIGWIQKKPNDFSVCMATKKKRRR